MKPFEQLTSRGQVRRLRRLARSTLERYALADARLTFLQHAENTTFRVDLHSDDDAARMRGPFVEDRFLLRIHRAGYNTADAIRSELAWLQALREEAGLAVPEPVVTPDGSVVVDVTGTGLPPGYHCSLVRWMGGRFYANHLRPAQLQQLGMLVAHLHEHAQHWSPPSHFTRRRWDWDGLFGDTAGFGVSGAEAWALVPERHRSVFQAVADQFAAATRDLGEPVSAFGLIHADLHFNNVLFADGEARAIDFDDCGFGYWLYDFAAILASWRDQPAWTRYRDAFFSGYSRVRPVPSDQLDYLDTFLAARRISNTLWAAGRSTAHPTFRMYLSGWIDEAVANVSSYFEPGLAH